MSKNITSVGARENEFLMYLAESGKNIFALREAVQFWGSPHNAKIAIHRLIEKGWLSQLEKGKYIIIPLEAGRNRKWSEDSFVVASALVEPAAIAYWSAAKHWNWTEQIPRIVYVQTTTRKFTPKHTIFGVPYEVVTVSNKKFFGHIKEWRNGKQVSITDKEKTLVDCADDVQRAGGIEELAKAVRASASEISWAKLGEYVKRFPIGAAKKRLGFLFETLVPNLPPEALMILTIWKKELSSGIVPLQPSRSKSGKISTRWGVKVNATVV